MATTTLNVEARDAVGKQDLKRLRAAGMIPANLYGHGEENRNLSICADAWNMVMRHGAHLVQLTGAVRESALIKHVQWDMMGSVVLHVDLTRTRASELVETTLDVELRGEAPGIRQGGIVDQPVHSIRMRCPAGLIPDKLSVSINHLELGQSITAGDVELPAGAELLSEPAETIVQCIEPTVEPDEDLAGAEAEPEVIGRQREDEGEDE